MQALRKRRVSSTSMPQKEQGSQWKCHEEKYGSDDVSTPELDWISDRLVCLFVAHCQCWNIGAHTARRVKWKCSAEWIRGIRSSFSHKCNHDSLESGLPRAIG